MTAGIDDTTTFVQPKKVLRQCIHTEGISLSSVGGEQGKITTDPSSTSTVELQFVL